MVVNVLLFGGFGVVFIDEFGSVGVVDYNYGIIFFGEVIDLW